MDSVIKIIDLERLEFYDSEIKAYLQRKINEGYDTYEVIVQKESLSDFPEVGNEKTLYINTSTNQAYRWSDSLQQYYPLGINWHLVSLTYDSYTHLSEKSENALYFLDNGQLYKGKDLISNVKVIQGGFPESIDSTMLGNFFISLATGEIRYAGEDGYVNISEIATQNIVLSEKNIKILTERIADKKTITMPKLEVVGNAAVWTPSNVDEIEVFIPLAND
jgi:hypothetical protein